MPEHVFVYSVSSVSSYVGGDIVSGVLASGLYKEPKLTLFIDIGTNGEIVIGNQQWLACAACSAGPAFEGGGIRFGMRATQGAIEEVTINPDTFEPMILTIGMVKPKGICGSGLINLLAALMDAGLVLPNGKFRDDLNTPRVRLGDSGREYVVVLAADTQGGQDLVMSEADIDNLMRAKGAMFAGYLTLLESVGLSLQDLEQVILAGAFGNFVNIDNAIAIGLLPDLPRDRYQFVGNASLLGATLLAFSREMLKEERRVAEMMTNFELSETPGFMNQYIAALFLPHTQGTTSPPSPNASGPLRGSQNNLKENVMPPAQDVFDRLLVAKGLLSKIRFLPAAHPDRISQLKLFSRPMTLPNLHLPQYRAYFNRLPDSPQTYLMQYFPAIRKEHPTEAVVGREYFSQLNRVRTDIKHHGIFPDPNQWYRVGERTFDYVSKWCQQYLGLSLDELDESALIGNKEVKEFYDKAIEAFQQEHYKESLEYFSLRRRNPF